VPCFIRWPGGKLGSPRDVDALTICQDVLPTLIELCDLPPPKIANFDGVSLAGLLRGAETSLTDRMPIIQFSRMNAPVPKRGDACVLWNKWRLVNDKELYDVKTDPGQMRDVAAEHADVVSQMRSHYASWWSYVAPRMNEPSAITVGDDAENPVQLSPADWFDAFIDQQRQVRMASKVNGPWHIEVARKGEYEITLSRWPLEADLPITAPAPEHKGPDGTYPPGVAVPAVRARLKIADFDEAMPMGATDKSISFHVALKPGRTVLQTWLYDADGAELCGAYYVIVRRR
jgi:arylsulfatase